MGWKSLQEGKLNKESGFLYRYQYAQVSAYK